MLMDGMNSRRCCSSAAECWDVGVWDVVVEDVDARVDDVVEDVNVEILLSIPSSVVYVLGLGLGILGLLLNVYVGDVDEGHA